MEHIRLRLLIASAFTLLVAACSQAPAPQSQPETPLAPQFGTQGDDRLSEVATNTRLGAIFVAGSTPAAPLSTTDNDLYLRRYARDGTLEWGVQFGNQADNALAGLAIGDRDQVYIASSSLTRIQDGKIRSFLKQYTAAGELVWSRKIDEDVGAGGGARVLSVTTDLRGDIFVTGDAGDDNFVGKYTAEGEVIWVKLYFLGYDALQYTMQTDLSGNLYALSYRYGSDVIRKYTSSGQLVWEKEIATGNVNLADFQIVGSSLYIIGYKYWNYEDVETDAYIAKLDLNGEKKWSKSFGTKTGDSATAITADSRGNVYVTGSIGVIPESESLGNQAVFVRKYRPSGSLVWTRQFGSPSFNSGSTIAALNPNEIYAGGYTGGDLGAGYFGDSDAFLTRFNSEGKQVWVR